jgi:membrane-anchored protein YejM (alkaline phosphatase superfamily)
MTIDDWTIVAITVPVVMAVPLTFVWVWWYQRRENARRRLAAVDRLRVMLNGMVAERRRIFGTDEGAVILDRDGRAVIKSGETL